MDANRSKWVQARSSRKDNAAASSSTSTAQNTFNKPIPLKDIPPEGVLVRFEAPYMKRRPAKTFEKLTDPTQSEHSFRPKRENESLAFYNRLDKTALRKHDALVSKKKKILESYPPDSEEGKIIWQQYLRDRADQVNHQSRIIRIKNKMVKENVINSGEHRHIKVTEVGKNLFLLEPIERARNYEQHRRREKRYLNRIRDPNWKPHQILGRKVNTVSKDDTDNPSSNESLLDSSDEDNPVTTVSDIPESSRREDPVLGFKVMRKNRTTRQVYKEDASEDD